MLQLIVFIRVFFTMVLCSILQSVINTYEVYTFSFIQCRTSVIIDNFRAITDFKFVCKTGYSTIPQFLDNWNYQVLHCTVLGYCELLSTALQFSWHLCCHIVPYHVLDRSFDVYVHSDLFIMCAHLLSCHLLLLSLD